MNSRNITDKDDDFENEKKAETTSRSPSISAKFLARRCWLISWIAIDRPCSCWRTATLKRNNVVVFPQNFDLCGERRHKYSLCYRQPKTEKSLLLFWCARQTGDNPRQGIVIVLQLPFTEMHITPERWVATSKRQCLMFQFDTCIFVCTCPVVVRRPRSFVAWYSSAGPTE